MNGGFSRPVAIWFIFLAVILTSLAGCSVFAPPSAPIVEPAPPAPAPSAIDAAAAASAAAAMPASATQIGKQPAQETPETGLHVLQKPKRLIKRFFKHKPAATPPPPAPTSPAPIIAIQLLPRDQARGLLDSEVQRPNGRVIGRAVDMLVDASGKPQEVVVNLSGFMGVGDVKTNFPWSEFHFSPATRKVPGTLTFGPGETPVSTQTRITQAAASSSAAGGATQATLRLMDNTVQDKSGAKVGRVVDVLIDGRSQPQAIVFDAGNSIGPNRHNIAASWTAVHFLIKDKALQLSVDLSDAQIKAAPPYSSDQVARVISPIATPPAGASPVAVPATAAPLRR